MDFLSAKVTPIYPRDSVTVSVTCDTAHHKVSEHWAWRITRGWQPSPAQPSPTVPREAANQNDKGHVNCKLWSDVTTIFDNNTNIPAVDIIRTSDRIIINLMSPGSAAACYPGS